MPALGQTRTGAVGGLYASGWCLHAREVVQAEGNVRLGVEGLSGVRVTGMLLVREWGAHEPGHAQGMTSLCWALRDSRAQKAEEIGAQLRASLSSQSHPCVTPKNPFTSLGLMSSTVDKQEVFLCLNLCVH